MPHPNRLPFAIFAVLAIGALTGCSATESTTELSLIETKSHSQLLRNDAIQRLPEEAIGTIDKQIDESQSCKPWIEDPTGLYRAWRSTFVVELTSGYESRAESLSEDLVDSFRAEGWDDSTEQQDSGSYLLTRTGAVRSLAFAVGHGEGKADPVTLSFEALGACVLTDGPGSEEVTRIDD